MKTAKLVGLLALAPFEALYAISTGTLGALAASNLLYAIIPLAAALTAYREGVAPKARLLLALAGSMKLLLILTTPSEPAHYAADTLATLAAAAAALEHAPGPAATIAVLAAAAGSAMLAAKHLAPWAAWPGLVLQIVGLLAAWAAMEARGSRGRA